MEELHIPLEAAMLAVRERAIVSVGQHALVPDDVLLELTANRSPIVDLVDSAIAVIDMEMEYEAPDGSTGTVVTHVHVINLHIKQRADGSLVVPLIPTPTSSGVPHRLRVLRYEA